MAIITISRGTKSGGLKLAECLARRLGYESVSREVVLEGAKKYNIMEEDLFHHLERAPSLWQKMKREHRRYLIFVQCALIDAVKQDNVIYHGYCGQLFLKDIHHVLKLRLDAPIEDRIQAVVTESGRSPREARDYINSIDTQRSRWVKYVFGEDWRDPSLYDMAFFTSTIQIATICDLVTRAVERPEFQSTDASRHRLESLSLECEVRAALASDERLWELPIDIIADNGTVTLRGMVKNGGLRDSIAELAEQVKGVRKCDVQIRLTTDRLARGIYGHD